MRWACAGPRCLGEPGAEGGLGGGFGGGDHGAAREGVRDSGASANACREPESWAAAHRTSCPLPAWGRALGAEAHAGPVARGAQQPYAGPGLPLNERAAANGSRRRR